MASVSIAWYNNKHTNMTLYMKVCENAKYFNDIVYEGSENAKYFNDIVYEGSENGRHLKSMNNTTHT